MTLSLLSFSTNHEKGFIGEHLPQSFSLFEVSMRGQAVISLVLWLLHHTQADARQTDKQEYFTEDIASTLDAEANSTKLLLSVRQSEGHLPQQCRTANFTCAERNQTVDGKGTFLLRRTEAGYRLHVRCPYDVSNPLLPPPNNSYAFVDCNLDVVGEAYFGLLMYSACPDSPFITLIHHILNTLSVDSPELFYLRAIQAMASIVRDYPTAIIGDLSSIVPLRAAFTILNTALDYDERNDAGLWLSIHHKLEVILDIADYLLHEEGLNRHSWIVENVNITVRARFVQHIVKQCTLLHIPTDVMNATKRSFQGRVICSRIRYSSAFGENLLLISDDVFPSSFYLNTSLHPPLNVDQNGYITFVYLSTNVLLQNALLYEVFSPQDLLSQSLPWTPPKSPPIPLSDNRTSPIMTDASPTEPLMLEIIKDHQVKSEHSERSQRMIRTWSRLDPNRFIRGPAFFLAASELVYLPAVQLEYRHNFAETISASHMVCALTPYTSSTDSLIYTSDDIINRVPMSWSWSSDVIQSPCSFSYISDTEYKCTCSAAFGYFGSFGSASSTSEPREEEPVEGDVDVFVGFPYSGTLYVISHVLRAISLACLLVTLLSYLAFPKTRQTRAVRILMNLCVSLVLNLLVLHLAEALSAYGLRCTAMNILRYYLVLVSLIWNGIEAHNMYMKLIRVFAKDIHHFVTKAAAIAWGLPACGVGIVLAVDINGFDGYYKHCIFRCALSDTTLFYAFLLPIGLIIIHNLTVFVMVSRVIFAKSTLGGGVGRNQRSPTTKLLAAVAMLVLLGVPWCFAAFGALDGYNNKSVDTLEAIFQVIFVVFVNAQGVFIFIFHAARNKDIRDSWRNTVGSFTTSATSKQNSKANCNDSHHENQNQEYDSGTRL